MIQQGQVFSTCQILHRVWVANAELLQETMRHNRHQVNFKNAEKSCDVITCYEKA